MEHTTTFACDQCGETKTYKGISTGYATDRDGKKICFSCCGENDKKELMNMKVGDKTIMYLINDAIKPTSELGTAFATHRPWRVSNWPGTLKIRCSTPRKGRHNIAGSRYDIWFDYMGMEFHGVQYGENTQVCHIKRIKG